MLLKEVLEYKTLNGLLLASLWILISTTHHCLFCILGTCHNIHVYVSLAYHNLMNVVKTSEYGCRWFIFRVHDDVIKWKHFPRYWPFVRWPVNSPHKGQWRGTLVFSLICAWINGWVNNREAGDLRRHRAHYDVIVMSIMEFPILVRRHFYIESTPPPWRFCGYLGIQSHCVCIKNAR